MLHQCALYMTKLLLKNNAIAEEEQDIYIYGWELIISTATSFIIMLSLSVVLHQFLGTVFFLTFYLLLRSCAGGHHANSYLGCLLLSLLSYGAALLLALKTPTAYLPMAIPCLIGLSVLLVFWRAPQDHPNRPVAGDEKKQLTKTSRILILTQAALLLLLLFMLPALTPYLWWATLGITDASISLLFSNWKKHA